MGIGLNIKQKRLEKQLSQEQLADMLHISQATLSNIEQDKSRPDVILLQHFAEALDTSLEELISKETIVINNNQQGGNSNNAYIINQLSEKLIEQYQARIAEKDQLIALLKAQLTDKDCQSKN